MVNPCAVRRLRADTLPAVSPQSHPHSLVAVHDGVQSVCDCDDRAVGELAPDGRLDEVICLEIHRGGGFI